MTSIFTKLVGATRLARSRGFGNDLQGRWLIVSVGLAGLAALLLPLNLLSTQPLHHDEALYATWGLTILSGEDPWLTDTTIDKPPLYLYTVAGAMHLLGVTNSAARLPSLAASALTVLLTFWLGRRIYDNGVGLLAAWLVAVSPFTLLFAPTAFTDPMLVTLVLGGCVAAAYHRPVLAGIGLGLALATKQQGIFFVPLVLALLAVPGQDVRTDRPQSSASSGGTLRALLQTYRRFGLALLLTLLPALFWDFARGQPSAFVEQSLTNYGGLSTDLASFGDRWFGFVELLYYGTASPLLNTIFLIGLGLLLGYGLWLITHPQRNVSEPTDFTEKRALLAQTGRHKRCYGPETRPVLTDWILIFFGLGYLFLHALLSFQVWDRYLLGLIPFLALLLARVLLLPWSIVRRHWLPSRRAARSALAVIAGTVILLLLGLSLPGAVKDAVNARYPLGSNSHGLHGIDQITAYLQGHVGANNTLYHHWLGAHWRFYLWDYPYDLQFWATPGDLIAKAEPGHLIAYPAWRSDTELRLALSRAGLRLRQLTQVYAPSGAPTITLYRIESKP